MLQSIDLTGTQQANADLELLRAYLQQLVNQPFLHFRFSYGDELSLHFGSPRKYASKRLAHLSKGSYIIAARASNWYLSVTNPPTMIVGRSNMLAAAASTMPVTKQQLESSTFVQKGARIVAMDAVAVSSATQSRSGYALTILLSDGTSLSIAPDVDEALGEDDNIADWEIFTPYERRIVAGPGLQWSYSSTKDPA